MAKLDEDWLGAFIASEIAGAIDWANNPKRQAGTLFQDDGSNLRKEVMLDVGKPVQLRHVYSVDGDAEVLLSDGFTNVRASLSAAVVSLLEHELEEQFDETTIGDVFLLREFTIACTTVGDEDKYVTLDVDEVDYCYHLRKAQGSPNAIEERPDVITLLDMIKQWRMSVVPVHIEMDLGLRPSTPPPVQSQVPNSSPILPRSQVSARSQIMPDAQPSSRSTTSKVKQPQIHATLASQFENSLPFATQVQQGRPGRPSLERDGYEVSEGINLAKPLPAPGQSVGVKAVIPGLASLLNAAAPKVIPNPLLEPKLTELGTKNAPPSSPPHELERAMSQAAFPIDENVAQKRRGSKPSSPSVRPDIEAEDLLISMSDTRLDDRLVSTSKRKRKAISPPSLEGPMSRGGQSVPRNQVGLLDKQSCWFPALPHERFSIGNVPIALLSKWVHDTPSAALAVERVEEDDEDDEEDDEEDDDSSSSISSSSLSDSEEEFYEWAPTPERQPDLPPDSSSEPIPFPRQPKSRRADLVEPLSSAGYTIQGTPSASQEDFAATARAKQTFPSSQERKVGSQAAGGGGRVERGCGNIANPQGTRKRPRDWPTHVPTAPAAMRNHIGTPSGHSPDMRADGDRRNSSRREPVSSSPVHFGSQLDSSRFDERPSPAKRHKPGSPRSWAHREQNTSSRPYESLRTGSQQTPDLRTGYETLEEHSHRQGYSSGVRQTPTRPSTNTFRPEEVPVGHRQTSQPFSQRRSTPRQSREDDIRRSSARNLSTQVTRSLSQLPAKPPPPLNDSWYHASLSNGYSPGSQSYQRADSRLSHGDSTQRQRYRQPYSPSDGPIQRTGSVQQRFDNRSSQPRSSELTRNTVIPGTQYSNELPRSPPNDTDPSARHRNRRSKYFWNEIRQAWIAAECQPGVTAQEAFARYKADHSKDSIDQADFNVYLEKSLASRLPPPPHDVQSPASSPPPQRMKAAPHLASSLKPQIRKRRRISTPPDDEPMINTLDTTFSIDRARDPASTARRHQGDHFSSSILDKASMPPATSTAAPKASKESEKPTSEPMGTYSALLRVVQRKHAPELQRDKQDCYLEFAKKYGRQRRGKPVFPKSKGMSGKKTRQATSVLDWKL